MPSHSQSQSARQRWSLTILAVVWLTMVGGVMVAMVDYSSTPGRASAAPVHWPAGSLIFPVAGLPNLILFAHPACPCTRATLGELEKLMAESPGKLGAQVWFIHPQGTAEDWSETDLWRTAAAIPGVTVHRDDDLAEARRFGAQTSGQTLLYDRDGNLAFQGGITLSRGHSGDNPGRDAVAGLLEKPLARVIQSPVFGCPLAESACLEGAAECKR